MKDIKGNLVELGDIVIIHRAKKFWIFSDEEKVLEALYGQLAVVVGLLFSSHRNGTMTPCVNVVDSEDPGCFSFAPNELEVIDKDPNSCPFSLTPD